MDANNVIAHLYAWPRTSLLAGGMIKGSRFAKHDHTSSTDEWQCDHCIQISFENLPKTSQGLVFGRDEDSDVVLSSPSGISRFHFSINFDDQRRLILKDLNSIIGTQVTFDDKGNGVRRNFQWLVGGVNVLSSGPIVIRIHDALSFELVPEKQDMTNRETMAKVDAFRRGSMADEKSHALDLKIRDLLASPRPETAPKLETRSLYLTKYIGKGGNGMATYRWNVSTGEETVVKKPICVLDDFHRSFWKREADMMRELRHKNILKLLSAKEFPKPRLLLEYCPGGTLSHIANQLSVSEMLQVLQQSLAGLSYLHRNGIIHRDVKHSNILVASRSPLKIKIADFGLSKHGSRLQTYCGTRYYMAPEILNRKTKGTKKDKGYNESVDIWALGMVFYQLLFGWSFTNPHSDTQDDDGTTDDTIVSKLNCYLTRHRGTLAEFVAKYMLQPQEKDRKTAEWCLARAMNLPPPNDRIQNRHSRHFAPLISEACSGYDSNTMPAIHGVAAGHANRLQARLGPPINDSGLGDSLSTFAQASTSSANHHPLASLGPQTDDSVLGGSASTFARSRTGHESQTIAYLGGAQTNDSGYFGALPNFHEAGQQYMGYCAAAYPLGLFLGNMPRQARKRTAGDAEKVGLNYQSRKRRYYSEEHETDAARRVPTPERWDMDMSQTGDDAVMEDDSPEC